MSADRRKTLIRVGVVAAVLFVVVILPGFLSTRPWYFSQFSQVRTQYASWSTSTHAEVRCEKCHVSPAFGTQIVHRWRMLKSVYLSPFYRRGLPKSFATPVDGACLRCHIDMRTVSPKGDLRIPHRAHVAVLKMKCVECHQFLVHEKSAEGKHTPPMAGCLKCHDGKRAKNACTICHTEKTAPDTHKAADWTVIHPQKRSAECEKCHAWVKDWCADCHARRPRSHVNDWRATHGDAVAKHRSCEACHGAPFCTRCHGEVPQLNFDPKLALVK